MSRPLGFRQTSSHASAPLCHPLPFFPLPSSPFCFPLHLLSFPSSFPSFHSPFFCPPLPPFPFFNFSTSFPFYLSPFFFPPFPFFNFSSSFPFYLIPLFHSPFLPLPSSPPLFLFLSHLSPFFLPPFPPPLPSPPLLPTPPSSPSATHTQTHVLELQRQHRSCGQYVTFCMIDFVHLYKLGWGRGGEREGYE